MNLLLQFTIDGAISGILIALLGVGFALSQVTGVFNFGFGGVYAFGAYIYYEGVTALHWNSLVALVGAVVGGSLLGSAQETLVFAPLRRTQTSGTVAMLSSLGIYMVMVNLLALLFGNENRVIWPKTVASWHWSSATITATQLQQGAGGLLFVGLILLVLYRSRLGLYLRAADSNPQLLPILGIDQRLAWLGSHALAGALAAAAACFSALDQAIDPYMGVRALLFGAVAALASSRRGAFKRAALLGMVLGLFSGWAGIWLAQRWVDTSIYLLLVGFLAWGRVAGVNRVRAERSA